MVIMITCECCSKGIILTSLATENIVGYLTGNDCKAGPTLTGQWNINFYL
jgi:hypothetical protein